VAPATLVIDTISVLFSRSPRARKALAAACHLADALSARIRVLLPAEEGDAAELEREAVAILAAHGHQAGFLRVGSDGAAQLAERIGRSANTALIAEVDHPLLSRVGLARCLELLAGPLLFVR
jgi:hypothetical protein